MTAASIGMWWAGCRAERRGSQGMTGLSEEDREHIRAEEIFRHEVRVSLADQADRPGVLAFLNSALGIWLLSTLVVGFGSWAYATYLEHLEQRREQVATLARLNTEMRGRVRSFGLDLERMENWSQALRALQNLRTGTHVYPEYANWSTELLVSEIRNLSGEDTAELSRALNFLDELNQIERALSVSIDFSSVSERIRQGFNDDLQPLWPFQRPEQGSEGARRS